MRMLHAVTVPLTARAFLTGQLSVMAQDGHEVHLVCSHGSGLEGLDPRVHVHRVHMTRDPQPIGDLLSLIRLLLLMLRLRPDVTVVSTPKAGLLCGVAAWVCRVPRRFYLLRGLRCEGATGARGLLLTYLEVIACRSAQEVVAVSPSLATAVAQLPLLRTHPVRTLGRGSSNGVDTTHFSPASPQARRRARAALGIHGDEVVFGFVGRLGQDKGALELLAAATRLQHDPSIRFVVVGDLEGEAVGRAGHGLKRLGVHVSGFVADTAPRYAAIDVLLLPTHREGFPNVVLEAAASGLPAITTTATGARDSVLDEVTGLLVAAQDSEALVAAVRRLASDSELRLQMGRAARDFALEHFEQRAVWAGYAALWSGATARTAG